MADNVYLTGLGLNGLMARTVSAPSLRVNAGTPFNPTLKNGHLVRPGPMVLLEKMQRSLMLPRINTI